MCSGQAICRKNKKETQVINTNEMLYCTFGLVFYIFSLARYQCIKFRLVLFLDLLRTNKCWKKQKESLLHEYSWLWHELRFLRLNTFLVDFFHRIKIRLIPLNTFWAVLQTSKYCKKIRKGTTIVNTCACKVVVVLVLCTLSLCPLSISDVSLSSLQYCKQYAPNKGVRTNRQTANAATIYSSSG